MGWSERFEKALRFIAPTMAARRMAAQRTMNLMDRETEILLAAWEAADHDRLRGNRWLASRLSADAELQPKLDTLRRRCWEGLTNDPYVASYVESYTTNTVGREIRVQSRIRPIEGDAKLNKANCDRWNTELETLWRRQSECIGVNGESMHEIQKLAMRSKAIFGEIIFLFSAVSDADRPVPLAVQVVDPARLETPPQKAADKNVTMGVERDDRGRVIAYWFRQGVLGDPLRDKLTWESIPADRVCHVFDKQHPDQTRGTPPLSPVLGRLKDLRDYHEAELIGQQVASCYSVIVSSSNPASLADANARLTDSKGNAVEEIAPGRVLYKGNDQRVDFASPNRPGGMVGAYTESVLRSAGAGSMMPYELLAKDYSRTTYSSGRLSLIDGRLKFQMDQSSFIDSALCPVWTRFVQQAVDFSGETTIDARDYNLRPWVYDQGQWMPPGWPWIDPQKDVQASADALVANLTTLSDELATRGIDFDEWIERRKVEIQKLAEAGITDITTPPPTKDVPPRQPDSNPSAPKQANASAHEIRSLRNAMQSLTEQLERLGVAA